MNKTILPLLLLAVSLASCTLTTEKNNKATNQNGVTENNSTNEDSGEKENQDTEEDDTDNQDAEEEHGDSKDSNNVSLDEWVSYEFHDGHKPSYNPDWDFYYGTSYEPRGALWENPNEDLDYSGIEFSDKKQYLESPIFNTYAKVEARFQLFFSAHSSSKYQAANNEPQFKVEEYNASGSLINTDSIFIGRSDVPNNNTALEKRIYITQGSMTHFSLKFNNFIPNGSSGYTAVLCKVSLKGYPKV